MRVVLILRETGSESPCRWFTTVGIYNKFQKLTPDRNVELGIYEEALDYAFSEEDVRNIAVSGAYGAGKSSVIESYEIKHPNRKFLHISLAHFEDVLPDQDNIMSTEDVLDSDKAESKELSSEVRLEGKILNQLIHQIDSDRIPLTDFKVKKETDLERLWGYTWWCIGFCLLFFFVFYNKQWRSLISGMKMSGVIAAFLVSRDAVVIAGGFLTAIVAKGVHTLLKVQSEKKILKKVSLQGNDIEIMEECKDSYFDRYLNEVLYLFEHVDAEAIVFEDIDRFGTNTIFEKLREINTLVGKRRAPLRFIYLLKDDIFESGDRTKFFDFIIPVVPVIDASNAYPIKIVQEKKYVDIVTEELTLISLFEMAIRPYGQLKGYFNRCILKGKDKEDIDYFYEEWIDKIYDEWPLTSAVITTGSGKKRVKKKNAGEISAVFLASILAYQKEKEIEVTIWSRDADCRMCMTELANQVNGEHLALRGEAIASFKNVDIVLREIFRKKLIEITDWNRIVDNIRFKKLVIDDNIDLIW